MRIGNDEFFKDIIDLENYNESIYSQLAKTMARNIDIDLAKTPLVDILTGYTRYKEAERKINKVVEYINEVKDKYYHDWGEDDGSYDTYLSELEIEKVLKLLGGDE